MPRTSFVRIDAHTNVPLASFGIKTLEKFEKKLFCLRIKRTGKIVFAYLCPECDLTKEKFIIDGDACARDDLEILPITYRPPLRLVKNEHQNQN